MARTSGATSQLSTTSFWGGVSSGIGQFRASGPGAPASAGDSVSAAAEASDSVSSAPAPAPAATSSAKPEPAAGSTVSVLPAGARPRAMASALRARVLAMPVGSLACAFLASASFMYATPRVSSLKLLA